jgi:hypothetical protein
LQKALTSQAVWIEDEECKGVDNRRVEGVRSMQGSASAQLLLCVFVFCADKLSPLFGVYFFSLFFGATSAHHACWGTPLLNIIGVALPLASKWVAGPSSWGGGNPV